MTLHTKPLRNTFGTCIVAIRTLNEVTLGTDSALSDGKNLTTVRKIITAGKFVFACAGFVGDENRILDIPKIAKMSLAGSKSMETALRNLERIIKKKVTKAFETATTDRKSRLVRGWRRNCVEIAVCSIEDGVPCIGVILLRLKRSLKKVEVEDTETQNTTGDTSEEPWIYLGGSKVTTWCKQPKRRISSAEAVSFVRDAIQGEIDYYSGLPETKRTVAPPICIAQMTKERTEIECRDSNSSSHAFWDEEDDP